MSRPNTSNDPQAPLLVGDRTPDGTEDETQPGSGKITIFNRTFSLFHLVAAIIGTLALIAIGISIAAIGILVIPVLCTDLGYSCVRGASQLFS
jgi:hypothetical protein